MFYNKPMGTPTTRTPIQADNQYFTLEAMNLIIEGDSEQDNMGS